MSWNKVLWVIVLALLVGWFSSSLAHSQRIGELQWRVDLLEQNQSAHLAEPIDLAKGE